MSTDKRDLRSGRRRAAYAGVYPWITEAWGKDAMKLAQGLPVTLRSQGLMITLATLQGKDGRAHRALAQLVAQRLLDSQPALVKLVPLADGKANEVRRLLAACANPAGERAVYAAAQQEALAFLDDVKVLSKALVDEKAPTRDEAGRG